MSASSEPPPESMNLMDSYGACLIAIFFSFALWGANCLQCFVFFTSSRKEHWMTKFLVTWLVICETVRLGLITRGLMDVLVLQWGNYEILPNVNPEWKIWQNMFFVFITCPSQGFYMFRIWSVLGRKWYLLIPMAIVVAWQFAGAFVYMGLANHIQLNTSIVTERQTTNVIDAILETGLVVDVFISATLIYILLSRRTGFLQTDRLIVRLVVLTVNTGLWTALLYLVILIMIAVAPKGLVYLALDFLTSGFYVTSVLANLNGRDWVRQGSSINGDQAIHMNGISTSVNPSNAIHVSSEVFSRTDEVSDGKSGPSQYKPDAISNSESYV